MTGTLAALARHAAERPAEWPPAAIDGARRVVADTLACILGGRREAAARTAATALDGWRGGPGGAHDLVAGGRLPAPWAALVNGTAAHALDYDDVLEPALAHASAVLVPALLALGEERGATGARLLDAVLIGFDVLSALAGGVMLAHYKRGWHSTLALGAPAAAAACGRLAGLDPVRMEVAIAAAMSFSSGSRRQNGTAMKPIHAGLGAQAGIMALALAEAGATASPEMLDGSWSFIDLFGGPDAPGAAAVRERLAGPPAMLEFGSWLKAYPCCASAHRAIDAMLALRARHGLAPQDIASAEADVSIIVQRNLMHERPMTRTEARFSMNHCLALAAEGSVGLAGFRPEAIARHRDFWPRVTMRLNPSLPGGGEGERCRLRVTLRDGRVLEEAVEVPKGHPLAPLSEAELAAKLRDCAAAGGVPEAAATRLLAALDGLAQARDLATLTAALGAAMGDA
jgi:2-methylcitrate dehydratase PrpD